jgi:hypothetical protein
MPTKKANNTTTEKPELKKASDINEDTSHEDINHGRQIPQKKVMSFEDEENARIHAVVQETMRMINANEITLGVEVVKKSVSKGNQKTDDVTNPDGTKTKIPVYDAETGEPVMWNDSYYVTFSFKGGEFDDRVTFDQYQELEIGHNYSARGRLKSVTLKDSTRTMIVPEFEDYQRLY